MLQLPFFKELTNAQNILLAGAGGGFDIFSGLPLYFGLKAAGKNVYLANLSFSFLPPASGLKKGKESVWLSPSLLKVTADTPVFTDYFPEQYLAQWLRQQGTETPIYCLENTGVKPLLTAYQTLVKQLDLDTVILVDGGTDSLLRGDEAQLGTPHEDVTSIAAVSQLAIARKMLVCLGFGVEATVCHVHCLEAVAELIRQQGYLGMFSLLAEMPEVQQYRLATEFVLKIMSKDPSIVCSSILAALNGRFGKHFVTPRASLWINPLMSAYWCFWLEPVANRILYFDAIKMTESNGDVRQVIKQFRSFHTEVRPSQSMPLP